MSDLCYLQKPRLDALGLEARRLATRVMESGSDNLDNL